MECGFKFTFGSVFGVWLMVEEAVGERSAEPLVEEHEEECDLDYSGPRNSDQAISVTVQVVEAVFSREGTG